MTTIKLKHVVADTDRHGNVRYYFRRPGQKKIRLRGLPGSNEFMEQYRLALIGIQGSGNKQPITVARAGTTGSLKWLCEQYYRTAEYQQLDDRTKRVRHNVLDNLCRRHGEKPVDLMAPRHVRQLRDEYADRPEAGNAIVKALRQVFAAGVLNNAVHMNPAREVPYFRTGSQGHHSWTAEEIAAFRSKHTIGTRARLAIELLLNTGQRRSDVVMLGKQHVRNGSLRFTQQKNRKRKPVTLEIPIVPELQRVIGASPSGDLTFLVTEFGRPFTAAGFGNAFRRWCNEAGLKNCSSHGLRKAAAARLAELGATELEIGAVTGHTTSKEISRYTRAARQKVLAGRAMAKLSADQKANKSVPLKGRKGRRWDTSRS